MENPACFELSRSDKWFAVAKRMEEAAIILQKSWQMSSDGEERLEQRAPEFLLWGLCLENTIKGLLVQKKELRGKSVKQIRQSVAIYDEPGHDLNYIAAQIPLELSIAELLTLKFYSKVIVYCGRSPIPTSSKFLSVYWDDSFDTTLQSLLFRLKKTAFMRDMKDTTETIK